MRELERDKEIQHQLDRYTILLSEHGFKWHDVGYGGSVEYSSTNIMPVDECILYKKNNHRVYLYTSADPNRKMVSFFYRDNDQWKDGNCSNTKLFFAEYSEQVTANGFKPIKPRALWAATVVQLRTLFKCEDI